MLGSLVTFEVAVFAVPTRTPSQIRNTACSISLTPPLNLNGAVNKPGSRLAWLVALAAGHLLSPSRL